MSEKAPKIVDTDPHFISIPANHPLFVGDPLFSKTFLENRGFQFSNQTSSDWATNNSSRAFKYLSDLLKPSLRLNMNRLIFLFTSTKLGYYRGLSFLDDSGVSYSSYGVSEHSIMEKLKNGKDPEHVRLVLETIDVVDK